MNAENLRIAPSALEERANEVVQDKKSQNYAFAATQIVYQDVIESGRNVGKHLCRGLWKLTYPFLGNMPARLQIALENKVGSQNYSAADASHTSALTNMIKYTSAAAYLLSTLPNHAQEQKIGAVIGGAMGLLYAVAESTKRLERINGYLDTPKRPMGSVPGWFISIPIAVSVGIYNFVQSVVKSTSQKTRAYAESVALRAQEVQKGKE